MAIRSWKFHGKRLALAALVLLALGWLSGHPLLVPFTGLVAYAAWQLVNLWRLYHWLQNPEDEVPQSLGIWSDIYDSINTMEHRNIRQKNQYRAMIGEFRSLTDAFPDATLVIDENEIITWFNSAAMTLLELKIPEDLGQAVTNLLRGSDFADWLAVQGEVSSALKMPSPRDDNTWLQISAVTLRETQRLIILRDVTDLHNVEQIRRDFVANISHELRTPLTVLQGYLELLEDNPADGVADAARRMLTQTGQIQSLLDDLLELSRLQSEKARGRDETVNIPAMLMQLKEQAQEISLNQHEITFEVDETLHLSGIAGDLESAFSNLITNAIKYTPGGGAITVTWRDSAEGPRFSVRDNGIGIPRRDIPRLTERFYRVGSGRGRDSGGSGLGLAIVKHVLNAHEADLSIESELGEGSFFCARFDPQRRRPAKTVTKES